MEGDKYLAFLVGFVTRATVIANTAGPSLLTFPQIHANVTGIKELAS